MTVDTGIAGYASLGADINKQKGGDLQQETKQGVVSDKLPELTLNMNDDDLVKFFEKREKAWKESSKKSEWEKAGEENEKYWLGKHFNGPIPDGERPMVDNVIFESLETYLPQATRRNPEPLVTLDSKEEKSPEKDAYLVKLKERLADLADKNKLRLKLKKAARFWAIFLLGPAKFGWDLDKDIPVVRIVRPKKLILDPDATIDEDGYTGSFVGEYRKMEASRMLSVVGEKEDQLDQETGEISAKGNAEARQAIKDLVKDDLATEVQFIEWWTRDYMCWQLGKKILLKVKNPHWNYDRVQEKTDVDDFGNETRLPPEEVKGINHFPSPDMPYRFLSVFNLGDQPMDKTSLIGQNLANQDLINNRNKQIQKNADRMNGGMVVSLAKSGLSQTQAKGVSEALRKGGVVAIPDGSPREAIDQYSPVGLPADVINQLIDTRSRLRGIFGVEGSAPAGIQEEKTVRGKIMNRSLDTDRIGGGLSEYLEQFADDIFNWFVQLEYVYDPGFQFLGGGVPPKVVISVKEGSLLPKDSISLANQAMELAIAGKMSLLDLFKRLEYSNPEEMAANVWLEANAPHLLYKDNPMVQQVVAMQQQAAAEAEAMKSQQDQSNIENDVMKQRMKHEDDLEKEQLKSKLKAEGEVGRSILSEVPQDQIASGP